MPTDIDDIERRFSIRNGAPLPPELRGMAARLAAELGSAVAACEQLEAAAEAERRYLAVIAKLGPMSDAEARLARDELAKGKPVSAVVAIVERSRAEQRSEEGAEPDDDGPSP